MKSKFLSLFFIIIFILSLTGCSKDLPTRIQYDLEEEPTTLDPQCATDKSAFLVINNLFEGLITIDPSGNLVNGLAEDHSVSEDGLTYHFTLRANQKWSNGYPLTANDFVFAFQRLFDPSTRSQMATSFYCIQNAQAIAEQGADINSLGVRALSDTELEIKLDYANSMFLQLLTTSAAMPCNEQFFYESKGIYGMEAKAMISCGPFQLNSWVHKDDGYIKLNKNEHYFNQANVAINGATLWTDTPKEEQLSRFLEGITHVYLYSGKTDSKISEQDDIQLSNYQNTVWGIMMNTQHSQLSNENLRKALAYCLDRERYENIIPPYLSVVKGIIPPGILLNNISYREQANTIPYLNYNLEQAHLAYEAALQELNVKKLDPLTLLVPSNSDIRHQEYFSYLSQTIQKEFNIFIAVEEASESAISQKISSSKDYDMAIICLSANYNHPMSILNQFSSGNQNAIYQMHNEQYQQNTNQILLNTDPNLILQSCIQAEQILLNNAIILPLYYQTDYLATTNSIDGVLTNPQNGYLSFRYAFFHN